jgi:hypothetical protein
MVVCREFATGFRPETMCIRAATECGKVRYPGKTHGQRTNIRCPFIIPPPSFNPKNDCAFRAFGS